MKFNMAFLSGFRKQFFRFSTLFTCFLIPVFNSAQNFPFNQKNISFQQAEKWADSVLLTLSTEEKIGQLLMVSAYSGASQNRKDIEWAIKKYKIGGVIFFKGEPTHQAILTNRYQQLSSIPLLVSMDAEWGVGMRLDSVISFPKQMSFGFANDSVLMYETGKAIARQCKLLGIHINFAPVADINSNPKNPVIHLRSFGEDKYQVTRLALAYMKGLQDNGIMAVAKHFPGHGDTETDSHKDLPVLMHDTNRLKEIELYPFRQLFSQGVGGAMVAHLRIPALDSLPAMPGSLSYQVVTSWLKDKMGFSGLVFTDALNMKGVTNFYEAGDIELRALLAGNDILLCPQDVAKAVHTISKAVKNGIVSDSLLNVKAKKILIYKYFLVSPNPAYIQISHLTEKLNNPESFWLKQRVIEKSISLLRNEDAIIPPDGKRFNDFFPVYIGCNDKPVFQSTLELYGEFPFLCVNNISDTSLYDSLLNILLKKNYLLIVLCGSNTNNVNNSGPTPRQTEFVNFLLSNKMSVLVNFGSPYVLGRFEKARNILQVTENDSLFQFFGAQALMGAIPVSGKLPVTVSKTMAFKSGIKQDKVIRLKYTSPFELGIHPDKLKSIDDIILHSIDNGVFPGCQLLLAKNGKVFFNKSYGYHTYEPVIKVKSTDIYDLASVTKVSATLLPVMKLYETGKLPLEGKIKAFLDLPANSNYAKPSISQLLTHEAGFVAWIPFYEQFLNKDKLPDSRYFSDTFSENYPVQVSDHLFAVKNIENIIWKSILTQPVKKQGEYVYSDIDFIFLKKIVENILQQPMDKYLEKEFYSSLGMNNTLFNPLKKVSPDRIPPTEIDNYFRYNIIQGFVHDPAAALMGGISGHAGLFSNANDLAKLFQMLLNHGVYGNVRYFKPETIDTFTKRYSLVSRRALGFDKPAFMPGEYNPCSSNTPLSAFGHTGFTGTCVWADPDNQLIFVFLSNRTYPDQYNNLINKQKTRQQIQEMVYKIIGP